MHEHHNHFDFILNAAEQLVKRQAQPPERVMYKTVRKVIQYDVTRRNFLNALNDICRLLAVPLNSYVLTRDSKDYDLYNVQVYGSGSCYYSTSIRIDSSFKNRFKVNLPSQKEFDIYAPLKQAALNREHPYRWIYQPPKEEVKSKEDCERLGLSRA